MKTLFHKSIFVLLLSLSGVYGYSQKKDSVKTLPPIPKDDVLQSKKKKFLYFVSNRVSEDEKYDLFKFIPSDREPSIIVIRGYAELLDNPTKKKVKITVSNITNNEVVGIYNTNSYTGSYLMVLVPNVKYLFKVESEGYEVMKEVVEIPMKFDYEVGKQEIKIKRNEQKKTVLNINNYFTDDNEKVFILKTSVDSTKKEAENAGYTDAENKNPVAKNEKNYSTIDELVKKQLEEEKKKPIEALKAFKNKEYQTALPLYTSLLKNDPGDPFMNYYYGVCLLKSTRNKAKAISCLELAAHFKETPREVFLYLAQAYHLSYMFRDAMRSLEEYKKYAKPADLITPELIQLVNNCKSGGELMNDQVSFEVLRRTAVQENNLPANYNPEFINDKLMYKTDFFNTAIDKKKPKLLMCKNGKAEIFYASYGSKDASNLDLYKSTAIAAGNFGPSQSLGTEINTPFDENYPYISKDGKTLYFSSKGNNSMGGYDIFKCTRSDSSAPWSKPQNMGYPINSTYDDILYIPDSDNRYASFCTNRKSDKFEYVQIKTWQKALSYSIIKGNFSIDSSKSSDAIITIFNSQTEEIAGVYKTNSENGNYLMVLSSGQSYYMTIESEGYPDLNNSFDVPEKKGDFILKQTIKLGKENLQKTFKVTNYFTEEQASQVVFESKKPMKEIVKAKKETEHKPEIKLGRPKRTPEESAMDAQNLKDAKNLFDQENYQEAALIYRQLELNIDLDAQNSYNYGVCLFFAKKDKAHCAQLLERASASKTVPVDVFYYLGKANHLNYKFSTAIKAYQKFMTLAKPAEVKKLEIEKEIEYCNNGLSLVNNPVVIEVFDKKHISLESVHNAFTHLESGAKVLMSTEDMLSGIDKKKKYKPVMYLSPDKNTIYYSSYGETEDHGKDIYRLQKMGNGKWSPVPFNIPGINSDCDEEFPSLSPDGKTLYFSSKGFQNMGGYDIFKSTWDDKTQTWSAPVNLGSPINSPYDDVYFVE
ncbi:MAG TPA: hypothetical protein VNZ49_12130 [Bacteroidia bacterium]|jgi:hypothetical protein|nr:hypothetical protein [Bacteroidia bacterium]